ncbi:hypothetical protein EYF80_003420 [Liparis tanakae]|uniref:Uncharacterized protein n=1 Tax=Liparis tanakae TaxID=230148 RepID=A0A4Z2J7M1_9TELE|nr:hypothetical protein EYF80_003420 [Liparis tanakae]
MLLVATPPEETLTPRDAASSGLTRLADRTRCSPVCGSCCTLISMANNAVREGGRGVNERRDREEGGVGLGMAGGPVLGCVARTTWSGSVLSESGADMQPNDENTTTRPHQLQLSQSVLW